MLHLRKKTRQWNVKCQLFLPRSLTGHRSHQCTRQEEWVIAKNSRVHDYLLWLARQTIFLVNKGFCAKYANIRGFESIVTIYIAIGQSSFF